MQQASLPFDDARAAAIDAIHRATAIYTVPEECFALLDQLGWPSTDGRLLDPGAGDGAMVVAALSRLNLRADDVASAAARVRGYEFHPGAAAAARRAVAAHLVARGWFTAAAELAASRIIEVRDFLLDPHPVGDFVVACSSPPYVRYQNIPDAYRCELEAHVPSYARGDLLYAYLNRLADLITPGGQIGVITADRWLINQGSAELRRRLGLRFAIRSVRRLDPASAFYRPKARRRGTPPRVHPVSMVLDPSGAGQRLTALPVALERSPAVQGRPLAELAQIILAPYLGPKGIFLFDGAPPALPGAKFVPAVEPADIDPRTGLLSAPVRYALVTHRDEEPSPEVRAHLEGQRHRMPKRGRRKIPWLPPETFAHRLPLASDAILVPRIASRLRPTILPAGILAVNHGLVVVTGRPAPLVQQWLEHPAVQSQASATAPRLENGYRSFCAAALRKLIIPYELLAGGPQ